MVINMNDAAKEYGGALFELAIDEGVDEKILGELRVLRGLFRENPGYIGLLSSPNITKEERLRCLDELLSGRAHPYVLSFLKLLTERNHGRCAIACMDRYEALYYETHGILRATAESAVPLTEAQQERLRVRIEELTGAKVELTCSVDPSLIAGVRLVVNNRLYEGSVKAKLQAIGESLFSVTL